MNDITITDFGYQRVTPEEKTRRVKEVFNSAALNYDLMNDLMSFGVHRLWKRFTLHISQVRQGERVLDLAGGTGDMTYLFRQRVGDEGGVVICDLNAVMLNEGKNRLINRGIVSRVDFVQANAENLPFDSKSFSCICIAFGLRNVTDKDKALVSMFDKLSYGGRVIILEFSKIVPQFLKVIYDKYSFKVIPFIGKVLTSDKESYQYLVESIRTHPDQEKLKLMMETAGFSSVSYHNLNGGIVAIHKGYKL